MGCNISYFIVNPERLDLIYEVLHTFVSPLWPPCPSIHDSYMSDSMEMHGGFISQTLLIKSQSILVYLVPDGNMDNVILEGLW